MSDPITHPTPAPFEIIQTARLDLIPLTAEFLRATIEGRHSEAAQLLGAHAPNPWPGYPSVYRMRLAQLEADPSLLRWLLRGMVLRSENRLIGQIGCHTAPDPEYLKPYSPGAVEFGFTVFEPYRRQGFATEASTALMHWARTQHGVRKFVVTIRPDNLPSRSVAAKFGFRRIGSHIDEVDGLEDIYERVVD